MTPSSTFALRLKRKLIAVILRRVEITLTGPDDYPEADDENYADWHRRERMAMFLFADHMRIALRQLEQELPGDYEIESSG